MGDGQSADQDDVWEAVATAWEQHRDRLFEGLRPVSEWLIDQTDPQEGEAVLELAAGPGETGFLAAARVGRTGKLISTDLSPTMVESARRGAKAQGLTNVEFHVIDVQKIELPDDSVDAVICRMGLMLVPDPRAAFREIRRVLRSGGRLAYAVMGPPDRNPWISLMMGALMQHGRSFVPGDPFALGGIFGLSSPDVNENELRDAGFDDVNVQELPGAMHFESVDDYWSFQGSVAGPVRMAISAMTPDDVAATHATLAQMAAPFQSDGGLDLPFCIMVAAAS